MPPRLKYPAGRILVFAKAPIAGEVKTRLVPALSAENCARLQQNLIRHTLQSATQAALSKVELWCTPDYTHPFFEQCARDFGMELRIQQGEDLGARMHRALADTLAHVEFVLLIGCDCPALDGVYLERACKLLADGASVVLGPAEDGGYVLIGARHSAHELFKDVDWGTPQVLAQTRERLHALGWDWRELETLWDLDRPEDLARWQTTKIAD